MLSKFFKLIASKKNFSIPKKKKILIIDKIFLSEFKKKFGKNLNFLDVRLKEINVYILLELIFSGKKLNFFNYLKKYIKVVQPKIVITGNDNLTYFYKFKSFFPNIKFISIQNGFRNKVFFKTLNSSDSLRSDYIFVFSKIWANYYKSKIKTKIISLGSFYNNQVKNLKKRKRKSILFVSSGYPRKEFYTFYNKYKVRQIDYFSKDRILFKNIYRYCEANNLKIELIVKNYDDKNEIKYYKNLISNKPIIIHENRNKKDDIYKTSDKVMLTVSSSSTFGFENIARGNKSAIFNNKILVSNSVMDIFWNLDLKKKGFFWSNNVNFNEVKKVMNKVLKSSDKDWQQKVKPFKRKFMDYNYKNKNFFNFLKTLN